MSVVALRRVATMRYGDALASDARADGAVAVMSSGGVTGSHDAANTRGPVIVIGRKGSHGSVWWSDKPAFVIDTAFFVDSRTTDCDLRWLYYTLSALRLDSLSNDVGVPGLSREAAHEEKVPELSLGEQRRIADFLDDRVARIDRIVAARRKQIDALDVSARSELANTALNSDERMPLRHLIVDERLGPWGAESGEDEVDVRVARVADFNRPQFRLHEVLTVRSAGRSQVQSRLLRHGDVLLERSGGTQRNPVGCPAFVESPGSNTVCSNFVSRLRPRDDVDGRYLSLVLGALYATRQQAPHSTQTTGIMNLNTTSFFRIQVPARDRELQVRLGAAMDAALGATRNRQDQLATSIDLLTEYKQALITAAVTGELDVTTAGSGVPG